MTIMKTKKVFIENKDGERIAAVIHNPLKESKATILLQHGLYSNKEGSWERRADYFAKNGFKSVRFDRRGYGESDGEFHEFNLTTGIEDSISVMNFLEGKGNQKYGIFGSSFGGLIAIHAASKDKRIKTLALRAPVTYHESVFSNLKEEIEEKGKIKPEEMPGAYIKKSFFTDLDSYDTEKAAKNIEVPTIIFHGENDSVVPIEGSKRFYELIDTKKKFEKFTKEGHIFSERKDKVALEKSARWFLQNL